jgi:hypothetical protein
MDELPKLCVTLVIGADTDGTVIDKILITGKDGDIVLDRSFNSAFVYADELLKLGAWNGFNGFTLNVVATN